MLIGHLCFMDVVKFGDRDPLWMKQELKSAINYKHRVYAKFMKRGRKWRTGTMLKIFKMKLPGC